MTREEAVKGLKGFAKNFSGYKPSGEMFDMAIRALEHPEENVVNIIPHGDLISRQAVLDCFNGKVTMPYDMDTGLLKVYLQAVVDAIDNLPSAEKTGHWIEDEVQTHVEKTYHCDKCGFTEWSSDRTEYCGGCGAHMIEEGEQDG